MYTYEYPRPGLAADCAVFRPSHDDLEEATLELLLVERDRDPFAGHWATPGGFVEIDEQTDIAAARELEEETGLTPDNLHQFGIFSDPDRDPRGRIVSAGYWTLISRGPEPEAASDARDTAWHSVDDLPPLAFDHDRLTGRALSTLRRAARTGPIGLQVLQARAPFQWEDVLALYRCILDGDDTNIDDGALTRAWTREGFVAESDGGLRCQPAAFHRAFQSGISPWLTDGA